MNPYIEQIRTSIHAILDDLNPIMDGRDIQSIKDFIKVNEFIVGMETLCDHIADTNLKVPHPIYLKIKSMCLQLGIKPTYWATLKIDKKNG